jgi:hypothetical protein
VGAFVTLAPQVTPTTTTTTAAAAARQTGNVDVDAQNLYLHVNVRCNFSGRF